MANPFDNLPVEGFRPQRYWLMARAFVRAGHDVTLWTSDFNHTTKSRRVLSRQCDEGFSVVTVPTRPYSRNISPGRLASHRAYAREWLRMARGRIASAPDLLVASMPPLSAAEKAMQFARETGAAFVLDVQDAWPETFARLFPRWAAPLAGPLLSGMSRTARALYRGADLVTGVCDRYADIAASAGAREYFRCYLGIDMPPPARPSGGGTAPRLVYAGGLGRTYDLATVLDAAAVLDGATLDIAGRGDGESVLRRRIAEKGLSSRVRMHGYLDDAALRDLFASCDIGVVPMRDDSFVGVPNKVADYSAAGLAVVSSLGGECAALLERWGAGVWYRPGDARSLAAAVRAVPRDAGMNARRMAEAEFDAVRLYDSYVAKVAELALR